MEFYVVIILDEAHNFRFNSQRDGILHFSLFLEETFAIAGFNSQRDGILLELKEQLNDILGFNSQRDGILQNPVATMALGMSSFNSQRDGILPYHRRSAAAYTRVSIPNGMEFYEASSPSLALGSIMFQFPTGWNST